MKIDGTCLETAALRSHSYAYIVLAQAGIMSPFNQPPSTSLPLSGATNGREWRRMYVRHISL